MTSVRKRLLQAALVLLPSLAQASYGSCQLRSDGLYLPAYCTQLDPAKPGSMPVWGELYGPDSRQWTQAQKRTFYDCHCQSYDEVAAGMARWGVNIDTVQISFSSGPSENSEVLNAIRAEFDAAVASVGGTPFYSSPWVYPGPSLLEGARRDPIVTATLTEAAPDSSPTDDYGFTWGDDGYSRAPGMMNVTWLDDASNRLQTLNRIDRGEFRPDASSRLGAYEVTRGYAKGTVGYAVHNAIGDIYMILGTAGQEQIGLIFNMPQARALFSQPVTSPANLAMATLEYEYWRAVQLNNPDSFGGNAGSAFTPEMRAWLQEHIYSRDVPALRNVPQVPPPPPGS